MRSLLFVLVVLLVPAAVQGQPFTPQQLTALNNLQEEFTRSGAYFHVLIACASPAMKEEATSRIAPTAKIFDTMAFVIGNKIGMTKDAMEQRLRRVFDEQSRITNNNVCLNIDSLLARRAARCKELGEHPETILDEYSRR
jgi:hypothetical protein